MEKSKAFSAVDLQIILSLLRCAVDINPVLIDHNVGIVNGICIFVESKAATAKLLNLFKGLDIPIQMVSATANPKKDIHGLLIHEFQRYDKEMDLLRFLTFQGPAIPMLIVNGAMPPFLSDVENFFPIADELILQIENSFGESWFLHNAQEYPYLLQDALEEFDSSLFFKKITTSSSLLLAFYALLFADFQFRRTETSEENALKKLEENRQIINKFENVVESYRLDSEILSVVRELIFNHIDVNRGYQATDRKELTEKEHLALERNLLILYDSDYYYVPEIAFVHACKSIKDIASTPALKQILANAGYLIISDKELNGFTSKKTVWLSENETKRPRFLKIKREFLVSLTQPTIEDKLKGAQLCF